MAYFTICFIEKNGPSLGKEYEGGGANHLHVLRLRTGWTALATKYGHLQIIHGKCMENPWKMHGKCMENAWKHDEAIDFFLVASL